MCTSNKTSDFGLHSCLIKSKQAINKREFYRAASVGDEMRREKRSWSARHQRAPSMTSPIKNTMRCYLNVMVGTGWLRVGLVSQPGMRSFDVADEGGETMREKALWGGEVKGRPATATAARARGRRQKWEDFWEGGGDRKQQSVRPERVLHNCSLSPRPRSRRRFDGDLMGERSTV